MWSKPKTVMGLSREHSSTKSSIAIFHESHVVRLDSSFVLTWSFGACMDRTWCICLYRTALPLLMEGKNWSSFDLDFWVTIYPCAIPFSKQTLQQASFQFSTLESYILHQIVHFQVKFYCLVHWSRLVQKMMMMRPTRSGKCLKSLTAGRLNNTKFSTKLHTSAIGTHGMQAHHGNHELILKDQWTKYTNSIVYIHKSQSYH